MAAAQDKIQVISEYMYLQLLCLTHYISVDTKYTGMLAYACISDLKSVIYFMLIELASITTGQSFQTFDTCIQVLRFISKEKISGLR